MKTKKCVWCGGKAKNDSLRMIGDDRITHRIKCNKCKFTLAGFDSQNEAITEWNEAIKTSDSREFMKACL